MKYFSLHEIEQLTGYLMLGLAQKLTSFELEGFHFDVYCGGGGEIRIFCKEKEGEVSVIISESSCTVFTNCSSFKEYIIETFKNQPDRILPKKTYWFDRFLKALDF